MLSEAGGELENGVLDNMGGHIFMPFFLITYVYETMINSHLELGRGFVSAPLILIKFFQALQG